MRKKLFVAQLVLPVLKPNSVPRCTYPLWCMCAKFEGNLIMRWCFIAIYCKCAKRKYIYNNLKKMSEFLRACVSGMPGWFSSNLVCSGHLHSKIWFCLDKIMKLFHLICDMFIVMLLVNWCLFNHKDILVQLIHTSVFQNINYTLHDNSVMAYLLSLLFNYYPSPDVQLYLWLLTDISPL